MKLLISDPLSEDGLKILREIEGAEIVIKTGMSEDELILALQDVEALIVRSETKVTKRVLDTAKSLRVIGRAGVGVDNIDMAAATKKGIIVMNTPDSNTISTAELTMAMMLATSRNIPQGYLSLKEGKWDRKKFVGYELQSKCLGIIGLGRIGRQVATRAQAFGMKTMGYDPLISPEVCTRLKIELVELNELFCSADYITVHTPLSPETKHIIGDKEIEMMKQGVVIINCARGGIVDEEALHKGLVSGKVRASALDVFEKEPPFDSPLLMDEKCIFVPHLGASTKEAQKSVGIEIANQMKEALTTGVMRNTVNLPYIDPETMKTLSPFIRLSEALGRLSAQLCDGKVTSIGIEYSGELVGRDLSLLSTTIVRSILSIFLPDETVNYVNAISFAKDMGIELSFSEKQARSDYSSLISVSIAGKEKRIVAGTVFSETNPRIVQIDDFQLELIGEGNLLILSQTDQPGIIGKIGTLLGSKEINIASLQLARTEKGGDALSVWSIDSAVSEAILQEIRATQEIKSAKAVVL